MTRVFNFGAGPAMLPEEVLRQARDELLDFGGTGMSVMEASHRGAAFAAVVERAETDLRALLGVPDRYRVLFLQGGASAQFAAVPLNLVRDRGRADYVDTGHWSGKAMAEARRFATVQVAASGSDGGYTGVPPRASWRLDPDAAYVHITPNETIGGVEYPDVPDVGDVPLVADVSSTILSRPLDVSRFGVLYAGAQKNIGPAGLAVVVVREDLLGGADPRTPAVLDWTRQAAGRSMLNTPPVWSVYVAGLVFAWLRARGGLAAIGEVNERKARRLYACIDASGGFYRNPVAPACRSRMNVPFTLADPGLDEAFLREAAAEGLVQLKGHRSVGGMRASIYNAMPEAGVDALAAFLDDFRARKG